MRKTVYGVVLIAGLVLASGQSSAMDKAYAGGGLGQNSVSGWGNAFGYQVFGGYELTDLFGDVSTQVPELFIAAEAGYMDSGEFTWSGWLTNYRWSHKGFWTTAVGGYEFADGLMGFGRAGLDFGDDDGHMFGGGIHYRFADNLSVRGEYVIRNNITSIQGNLIFHLGQ